MCNVSRDRLVSPGMLGRNLCTVKPHEPPHHLATSSAWNLEINAFIISLHIHHEYLKDLQKAGLP